MEEGKWDSLIAIPPIQTMDEVTYRKIPSGSFALFNSAKMLTGYDLGNIFDCLPSYIIQYFITLYNAKLITTNGSNYLFFRKEKQAKRAVEYINGIILTNKLIGIN